MRSAPLWPDIPFLRPRADLTRPEALVSMGVLRAEYAAEGVAIPRLAPQLRRSAILCAIAAVLSLLGACLQLLLGIDGAFALGVAAGALALVESFLPKGPVTEAQPFHWFAVMLLDTGLPLAALVAYLVYGSEVLPVLLPLAYAYIFFRVSAVLFLDVRLLRSPDYLHELEVLAVVLDGHRGKARRAELDREVKLRRVAWDRLDRFYRGEDAQALLAGSEFDNYPAENRVERTFPVRNEAARAEVLRQLQAMFDRGRTPVATGFDPEGWQSRYR
jgi:hypothetical protein